MKRHFRENYYIVGEGVVGYDDPRAPLEKRKPVYHRPSTTEQLRKFRFSRLGPKGEPQNIEVLKALATAMTVDVRNPDSRPDAETPAGYTYLAQFVDHDMTLDKTAVEFGEDVTVAELLQGRSPALDLDSLYGRGPNHPRDRKFYASDGIKLRIGRAVGPPLGDRDGFDLPRSGVGSTQAERRTPVIPDARNDENLAVAQTHVAFIRFHNKVVDQLVSDSTPSTLLFSQARKEVVRHYQWLLKTDFLPRIVDPSIVDDVFTNGRRYFEVAAPADEPYADEYVRPGDYPTVPIEFAVAAYRLGHSMVRGAYDWNRFFNSNGPLGIASLLQLFTFSGVSGNFTPGSTLAELDDPNSGTALQLPTIWITDFQRLYDFSEVGRADLAPADGQLNATKRIDTLLVNPLAELPAGSFAGRGTNPPADQRNLAFRNLIKANMVSLASGQQMAEKVGVTPLKDDEILNGDGGASLAGLSDAHKQAITKATPLWFYILREAELGGGRLGGVGGRIVAEVFHRSIEGSRTSILRDPEWRPTFGADENTFRMVDLLLAAYDGKKELLNPLGDTQPPQPGQPTQPTEPAQSVDPVDTISR